MFTIEGMRECTEHAVAVGHYIVHTIILTHQEAFNISRWDGGADIGTRDVGTVTPGGSMKLRVVIACMCMYTQSFIKYLHVCMYVCESPLTFPLLKVVCVL